MNNSNGQVMPPDIPTSAIAQPTNTAEKNNKYDSRNYLDFSIPKGQTSRTIKIRLLPVEIDETGTPQLFKIIHMHSIKVHKDLKPNKSGKKSYVCLKKNKTLDQSKYGTKCPICEAESKLWEAYNQEKSKPVPDPAKLEELRKAAGSFDTREYCIVRCIERGKEDEGPKFWRFMLRLDNADPYHALIKLAEYRKQEALNAGMDINIFSIYNGKDINITFSEGNAAPVIVDDGFCTRLTNDDALLQKWYYDEKKWNDVFGIKPYEYLNIAQQLQVPFYNKEKGLWVPKENFDSETKAREESAQEQINQAEAFYTQNAPASPAPMQYAQPMANPVPQVAPMQYAQPTVAPQGQQVPPAYGTQGYPGQYPGQYPGYPAQGISDVNVGNYTDELPY